ncbi:MAG TPA: hypothetical protein ACFCUC_06120 [Desulfobacterales bacterium]
MSSVPALFPVILLTLSILVCNPVAADVSRHPPIDLQRFEEESFDEFRGFEWSGEPDAPLLDIEYGFNFWKKNGSNLRFALVDGPSELPSDFGNLGFGPEDVQISSLLILLVPLENSARHPKGRFRLYGGIGPGLSLIYEEPLATAGRQSMDFGVDVRFGILWSF